MFSKALRLSYCVSMLDNGNVALIYIYICIYIYIYRNLKFRKFDLESECQGRERLLTKLRSNGTVVYTAKNSEIPKV